MAPVIHVAAAADGQQGVDTLFKNADGLNPICSWF
jgi:hypothetical protein